MIPIEDSFLYVEPIFLKGAGGGIPALKAVVVVTGDRDPAMAVEDNLDMNLALDKSLALLFGETPEPPPTPPPDGEVPSEIADLVESIQAHLAKMQEYAGAGNWAAYGEELDALEAAIESLAELTAEQS